MKVLRCSRTWQAEAVKDGRLSPSDRESFERHLATCQDCTREVRALAELEDLAGRVPMQSTSALERRRLRNEILRRANELSVREQPRTPGVRFVAAAAALVLLAAALFVWLRLPLSASGLRSGIAQRRSHAGSAVQARPQEPRPPRPTPPIFQLQASKDAEWRSLEQGRTLRIAASRGRFELSVHPLHADQRFLLDLPDGELEVKGTRFVVQIDGARTRSVHVSEGRVVVRLRGHAPLTLGAGEAWSASPSVASAKFVDRPQPAVELQPPQASADAGPAPASAQTAAPQSALPTSDASGAAFTHAMSAFSAGSYSQAERLLLRFEALHPADARVEDSAFLRAIARARRGDAHGARVLAREYLQRYPHGLRRAEAERMTQ